MKYGFILLSFCMKLQNKIYQELNHDLQYLIQNLESCVQSENCTSKLVSCTLVAGFGHYHRQSQLHKCLNFGYRL